MIREERRLAAIMFSDICGFSKAMGQNERRALRHIKKHISIVQAAAEEFGGNIIKKMGDGLLVEFSSAVLAVRSALKVQKEISRLNADVDESERFYVRIGIHLGDVVVAGNDILGDGVNVASRIEPLAEPGGICISRDIFDLVKNKIEIETVHIGAPELKNISRKISIYKVLIDAFSEEGLSRDQLNGAEETKKERMSPLPRIIIFSVLALVILAAFLWFFVFRQEPSAKTNIDQAALQEEKKEKVIPAEEKEKQNRTKQTESKTSDSAKIAREEIKKPEKRKSAGYETDTAVSAAQDEISSNYIHFLQAIQAKNLQAARQYISPDSRLNFRGAAVRSFISRVGKFIDSGQINNETIKIQSVDFSPDESSATVIFQFFRKDPSGGTGNWQSGRPSDWKKVGGTWFLIARPFSPPKRKK